MSSPDELETRIIQMIKDRGPLTGAEISAALKEDQFLLWRACRLSENLQVFTIGRRYLRLDRNIDGFARLSPSILREFLTYSAIGLQGGVPALLQRGNEIDAHIKAVSREKLELARSMLSALLGQMECEVLMRKQACFIIAGDIVYEMAHDVPRPERSTGKMIHGSDIDLVVVVDDEFPRGLMERLDSMIYQEKQKILMTPHLREEIDYIVKDLARVRTQLAFDTFKHMLACKILQEGVLLYGSENLFHEIKSMLNDQGITEKLTIMEHQARIFRKEAERHLLTEDPASIMKGNLSYFYPTEESEEFD
ncbi:MAG: hypothetical protein CVU64_18760 [Deltaproteobacteria bacterium HGW-Deltaproteobacteria-21]|nr:MAG: hypothetical protein CVU64_18760 [Deltaproteobacteria bacterium HGW-Deltaproteobacteria-21]